MPIAYAQAWLERDRWSGPSQDGYSMYPTRHAHEAHMREFNKERDEEYEDRMKNKLGTPECYSNPEGKLQEVFVSDAYYQRLCKLPNERDRIYPKGGLASLGDWKPT